MAEVPLTVCTGRGLVQPGNAVPKFSPQSFEWIAHDDITARSRARSHITRSSRREQAAQAQQRKANVYSGGQALRHDASETADTVSPVPEILDYIQILPCLSFPISMNPSTKSLVKHYFSSESFVEQPGSNYQAVKSLIFKFALPNPSVFHILLAGTATDLSVRSGFGWSKAGVKHYHVALQLVNHAISKNDSSDGNIVAVVLFLSNELLFGNLQSILTHQAGLATLLRMRGGMETIRYTSPLIYSLISWIDFSASCNLTSMRRFLCVESDPASLSTQPYGVPEAILQALPAKYDMYRVIAELFAELQSLTCAVFTGNSKVPQEVVTFTHRVERELSITICLSDEEGNRSRHRHIIQSFNISSLIYIILISDYKGAFAETRMRRFEKIFSQDYEQLGAAISDTFRSFLTDRDRHQNQADLSRQVARILETVVPLGWENWRSIKISLLEFLVNDTACESDLQASWKARMAVE